MRKYIYENKFSLISLNVKSICGQMFLKGNFEKNHGNFRRDVYMQLLKIIIQNIIYFGFQGNSS